MTSEYRRHRIAIVAVQELALANWHAVAVIGGFPPRHDATANGSGATAQAACEAAEQAARAVIDARLGGRDHGNGT